LALATSSAKHLGKDIAHTAATIGFTVKSIFSVLVISFTFFSVAQNIISSRKFLELLRVPAFIRVFSDGSFTEMLSNFVSSGSLFDSH